jgi:hypothetical protein
MQSWKSLRRKTMHRLKALAVAVVALQRKRGVKAGRQGSLLSPGE